MQMFVGFKPGRHIETRGRKIVTDAIVAWWMSPFVVLGQMKKLQSTHSTFINGRLFTFMQSNLLFWYKYRFHCNMECGSRNCTWYSWKWSSKTSLDKLRFSNTSRENRVKNLMRVISNKAVNKYCWMVFEQTYVKWYGGLRKCSTIFSPCDYFFFIGRL